MIKVTVEGPIASVQLEDVKPETFFKINANGKVYHLTTLASYGGMSIPDSIAACIGYEDGQTPVGRSNKL